MIAAFMLAAVLPAPAMPGVRVAQAAPTVEVWQVDQLRLPVDTPEVKLKALEPDHTMDAVIARLKTLGVTFTRGKVGLVPSRMPAKLRDELATLPEGEPFVLPSEGAITINVIIGRQLPPDTVRYTPPASRRTGGVA